MKERWTLPGGDLSNIYCSGMIYFLLWSQLCLSTAVENETAREEEEKSLAMSNTAIIAERTQLLQHLGHSRTHSYYIYI